VKINTFVALDLPNRISSKEMTCFHS